MPVNTHVGVHAQAWSATQTAYANELTALMLQLATYAGPEGIDLVVQDMLHPLTPTPGLKAQARKVRRENHLRETATIQRRRAAYEAKRGNK